jgi:hypothetical protein
MLLSVQRGHPGQVDPDRRAARSEDRKRRGRAMHGVRIACAPFVSADCSIPPSRRQGRLDRSDFYVTRLHAELIALGIGQHDPAKACGPPAVPGQNGGTQGREPLHLCGKRPIDRVEIEMQPVLHLLGVGDFPEKIIDG